MKDYDKVKAQGSPFDSLIQDAANAHGVSYDLLHKQLFAESSFNPKAKSPTGPRGIGQFTKATGKAYGLLSDEDFYDPAKSIDAAAVSADGFVGDPYPNDKPKFTITAKNFEQGEVAGLAAAQQ